MPQVCRRRTQVLFFRLSLEFCNAILHSMVLISQCPPGEITEWAFCHDDGVFDA